MSMGDIDTTSATRVLTVVFSGNSEFKYGAGPEPAEGDHHDADA